MLKKRLSMSTKSVKEKSSAILRNLSTLSEFQNGNTIMIYLPIKHEPDTHPLMHISLKQGKKVCLPISNFKTKEIVASQILNPKQELQHTEFGIMEPSEEYVRVVNPKILDIVIVPGVAFDEKGHRLGYGQGFYDKFISSLPKSATLIGLTYEQQILEKIPSQKHDQKLHFLVTEKRVINTSRH